MRIPKALLILLLVCPVVASADERPAASTLDKLQACAMTLRDQLTKVSTVTVDSEIRTVDCEDGKNDDGTLYTSYFVNYGRLRPGNWQIVSASYNKVENSPPEDDGWVGPQVDPAWVKFAVKCPGFNPAHPKRRYGVTAILRSSSFSDRNSELIGKFCSATVLHPGAAAEKEP